MGLKTHYFCDVCDKEVENPKENKFHDNKILEVIFTTEQNEGRTTDPHLECVTLDICDPCLNHLLEGNYVFGQGAMGHNKYEFKK